MGESGASFVIYLEPIVAMLPVLLLASSLLVAPLHTLRARAPPTVAQRVRMAAEPIKTDCLVIGAGISGATLAHNLHKNGVDMLLTEARDYVGGNVFSHNKDGFIWEEGPNSFATQPAIVRIAYELGISDQLVFADESLPPWVNHNGKLHPLPKGKGGKGPKGQLELVFGSNGVLKFGLAGAPRSLPTHTGIPGCTVLWWSATAATCAARANRPAPVPTRRAALVARQDSRRHRRAGRPCASARGQGRDDPGVGDAHPGRGGLPAVHRPVRLGRVCGRPRDALNEGRPLQDCAHRALRLRHRVEQVWRHLLRRARAAG